VAYVFTELYETTFSTRCGNTCTAIPPQKVAYIVQSQPLIPENRLQIVLGIDLWFRPLLYTHLLFVFYHYLTRQVS
jgi:hypothetical protein